MKNPSCLIVGISLFLNMIVNAQSVVIKADVTKGCDSLSVYYTYTTTLPSVTSVKWDFGSGVTSASANPTLKYNAPGSYSVKLVLNGTDSVAQTNLISVGKTPKFSITYKDTVAVNTLVIRAVLDDNNPPFPNNFAWTIDGGITDTHSFFVHQFDTTGTYKARLIVSDAIGCADTVQGLIVVADNFLIPNVFTPNGDTKNDDFTIVSSGKTVLKFQVYGPTGVLVYKTEARNIVWDGRIASGEKVSSGIYFYTIESLDSTPAVKKSGYFYVYY